MNKLIDMTGQRYGRLVVRSYKGSLKWECVCDCGVIKHVSRTNLTSSQIMSCGCLFLDTLISRNTRHGRSRTTEYKSWSQAKSRCALKSNKNYDSYGGRGITMCESWLNSFENFLADMGPKPKGTSLDRKNNDLGYEPGNCRWATKKQQANNRRTTTHLTAFGETKSFADWAADPRCVVKYVTLSQRIRAYGWQTEAALTTPAAKRGDNIPFTLEQP